MAKKDFTEKELRDVQQAVNRMMDGGKFDKSLDGIVESLAGMVDEDRENSGFILVGRNGKLGKVFCAAAGTPANIMAALDSSCDEQEQLDHIISTVVMVRRLNGLRGNGKEN